MRHPLSPYATKLPYFVTYGQPKNAYISILRVI
jgi:hypothetical protein